MTGTGFVVEIWWAAIEEEKDAIAAVRKASNSSDDIAIEVIGKLSPTAKAAEGMAAGVVRPAT